MSVKSVALQPPSCQHSYATTDVHVSVCSEIKDCTFTSDSVRVETGLYASGCVWLRQVQFFVSPIVVRVFP